MRRQDGQALIMILVAMLIVQATAWAFLSRMNVEQRVAGGSTRSLAAFYLAEAALQKALWLLEEGRLEPGVNGEASLPISESSGSGALAIESLQQLSGGLISIIVRGEVGGVTRRVRALVRAGPEALAYGLFSHYLLGFDGRSSVYVVPCGAGTVTCRRGGHVAVAGEVRIEGSRAAINDFRGTQLEVRNGPIADQALLDPGAVADPSLALVDLVVAGKIEFRLGLEHTPVEFDELRRRVEGLGLRTIRHRAPLQIPSVDLDDLRELAEANTANAGINAAAAATGWQPTLRDKRGSSYTEEEFVTVLDYLKGRPGRGLQGVVLVDGDVTLEEDGRLVIEDGTLVARDIQLNDRSRLEVRHTRASRALPGVIVAGNGTIQILKDATAIIDGLLLNGGDVRVVEGVLDVTGAVATRIFLIRDGTAVIRYDPEVLSTVGLQRQGRAVTVLVSWQELI